MKTPEELETFMLKHGENIIDTLGAEVDRLEKELKVRYIHNNNIIQCQLLFEYLSMSGTVLITSLVYFYFLSNPMMYQ